jgi:beta-galactosidase
MQNSRRDFIKKMTIGTTGITMGGLSIPTNSRENIFGSIKQNRAGLSGDSNRKSILFDFDWKFFKGDPNNAEFTDYNDLEWRDIQLPHDWSIEGEFDRSFRRGGSHAFLHGGIGWYRKHFNIPPDQKEKEVLLHFDGVYMLSDVYINGQHVGNRPYGYVPFEYYITPYLLFNENNVIAVRVDHSDCPTSRWYSGSGIYRHVWLTYVDLLHVATWGTYVTTPEIKKEFAKVKIQTSVNNHYLKEVSCELESLIIDKKNKTVGSTVSTETIASNNSFCFIQDINVNNPFFWDIENPNMYILKTIIKSENKVVDEYETPFGIREIVYDSQKGFFLNGNNIKMKGFCLHQDAGSLGTAVPDRVNEYRLEILKEFGVNAIRCSHNPPSAEFLDICDKMGFLVIDEAFDKWKSGYYAKYFDDWWQKDLDAMLLRDRNHPSIVMWSVGNEVAEQGRDEGVEILKMLVKHVHEADSTRPVTCAIWPGRGENRIFKKDFSEAMDIVSLNYSEPWYESDKKEFPERIILGSECFPYYRGRYGSVRDYSPVNPWYDVVKNDFVIGEFIWIGIDYLGESSGWPSKGWPTGLIDVCGFLKPRSYFHRSVWNNKPIVGISVRDQSLDIDPGKDHWQWPHLASHWNFSQYRNHVIQVETVTNCETVELLLNNRSFGVRRSADYPNSTIVWHVPYRAGVLKAVARNNSNIVAENQLQTSGKPAKIQLIPDRDTIKADGQDTALIKVKLLDENNILVPDSDMKVQYNIEGNGKLIGLDNGDLRNDEPFKSNIRTTYWGKSLAVIQSERVTGNIIINAKAEGLPLATIIIKSL